MSDLKNNHCQIIYHCIDYADCVYRDGGKYSCDYQTNNNKCNSAIARVNILTLELERLTDRKVKLV